MVLPVGVGDSWAVVAEVRRNWQEICHVQEGYGQCRREMDVVVFLKR